MTKDTFKGFNDNPISLNLYTYANGNPIIYTDPDGHLPAALIGSAMGAISAYAIYWLEWKLGLRSWNWYQLAAVVAAGAFFGAFNGGLTGFWKLKGLLHKAKLSQSFITKFKNYQRLKQFVVNSLIKKENRKKSWLQWARNVFWR